VPPAQREEPRDGLRRSPLGGVMYLGELRIGGQVSEEHPPGVRVRLDEREERVEGLAQELLGRLGLELSDGVRGQCGGLLADQLGL
jgi:hypothetical protein